jgi:hypothetical protein
MPVERIGVLTKEVVKLRDNAELRFGDGAQGADWDVSDVYIRWDATDLDMLPTTNNTVFKIGNGTLSMDVWLYGSASTKYLWWDASASLLYASGGAGIAWQDSSPINLGNSNDVVIQWDASQLLLTPAADDTKIALGTSAGTQLSFDVDVKGSTSAGGLYWDASADLLSIDSGGFRVNDSDRVLFGDSNDITAYWDAAQMIVTPLTDDTKLLLGVSAGTQLSFDVVVKGSTSAGGLVWDASADTLSIDSGGVNLGDGDHLRFGDSQDVDMYWDAMRMVILPSTDDYSIEFGISAGTQKSPDVRLWGNDSASYLMWDASESRLVVMSGGYSEKKTWTVSGGAIAITYGTSGSTGYIPIYTTAA